MSDDALLQQAIKEMGEKRYAKAVKLARLVKPNSASYPYACHVLGVIADNEGKFSESFECFRRAARLDGPSPLRVKNLAIAAYKAKKIDARLLAELRELMVTQKSPASTAELVFPVLSALNFTKSNGYAHTEVIFEHYVIPMLRWCLENRAYDMALILENSGYSEHIKQRETEEHFQENFSRLVPDMLAAGRKIATQLPPFRATNNPAPQKIGFFIHQASMLAHIEALANTLAGYRQLADQPFEPIVYCLLGEYELMTAAFQRIGVPVINLAKEYPSDKNSYFQLLLRLRERLEQDGVNCIVWTSLMQLMPLAFSMRIAPVQIRWSMKYHRISFDEIDGYVTSGSFSRTEMREGRLWRAGRLQVAGRYDPSLKPEADAIAHQYRPKKIIGTLARHELIRSKTFLDAVVMILQDNPDCVFLWTGRESAADIVERFRDAGVLDRTHFVGWVNIKVYAQVLDVFLDTFPFGCGFTVLDTMAAGTPVVFMATPVESGDPSYDRVIWPMISGVTGTADDTATARAIFENGAGEMLFQHALNTEQYVGMASRLLRDPEWTAQVGAAGKRFIDTMMSDPSQSARDFSDHFMAIIKERKDAGFP